MKIDKTEWKEFCFDDTFSITRGKRLKTADQIAGDTAYISSTKLNNGIDNYVSPPDKTTVFNNAITLNNSGSIGYCFYHAYNFIASDHCTILKIKDKNYQLTPILFLFLKPVIEAMKVKYSFAREMSNDRLKNEKILLPQILDKGGDRPDWDYMESFIKHKAKSIVFNSSIKYPKNTLDLKSVYFKEFSYGGEDGVFNILGGYYNKKPDHIIEGDIPFIGASKENNGFTEFYSLADLENCNKDKNSKQHSIEKKIFSGNCITVANNGSAGSAFYQKLDFTCSHDINVLYLKEKDVMNKYIGLFLCTLIKLEKFRWDFGRKWRPIRMPISTIKLPVDSKGNPDWRFMEHYIKSLPYSSSLGGS